jgi:hypothetical protein
MKSFRIVVALVLVLALPALASEGGCNARCISGAYNDTAELFARCLDAPFNNGTVSGCRVVQNCWSMWVVDQSGYHRQTFCSPPTCTGSWCYIV